MSEVGVKPTLTKGCWTAPTVLPSWHQCVRDPNAAPASATPTGQVLPQQIDFRDYPYTQYWFNVEAELNRLSGQSAQDAMEEEDPMGVPLPDRPTVVPVKPKVDVRVVFDAQCAAIENIIVPLGIINPDGSQFKFVMPPGHMGDQINKRVFGIPYMIRQAAGDRYRPTYEIYLTLSWVLPVPLHTSPLALLLTREAEQVMRYKDAISTLHGLHILRHAMHEMDTDNQQHKAKCWAFYKKLEAYVAERFWAELDRIAEQEKQAMANSPVKEHRSIAEHAAAAFGRAASRFALDMVHAIEWCIMDILRLPYEWRKLFMTPNEYPAGEALYKVAFERMRTQTIRYLGERNKIYCGLFEDVEDPKTKVVKRVYKGIDPTCWAPMHLDSPPLADRPTLLGTYNREIDPQLAASCLFGIFNGWIDLHTLREYTRMLEVDSRPETAARVEAFLKGPDPKKKEEEQQQQVSEATPMDTGEDVDEGDGTLAGNGESLMSGLM